jgi:predicted DNA-binding transcriptional regulator AlpA
MPDPLPIESPLLLDADGVCQALSIGISHLHALRRTGKFPVEPLKLGGAVRWRAADISAWITAGCPAALRWKFMHKIKAG